MKHIELERPHGFLVWKGKQTAIAADEPLPVGEPVLIVSDGEAFGVAVLRDAAQMKDREFDGKAWQSSHRVYPEERRRFWPDATAFYVHRIESFEGYSKPKLFDGEAAIDYDPTDDERALMDQSRRLPKQIILNPDAVVLSGGKVALCDGVECTDLTEALKATYEAEPVYGDGDGENELTIYKLALVREPRMVVKKKSPDGNRKAADVKELEISINLEEPATMPYRISERGAQVCVVKTETGEAVHCYTGAGAMEEAQALLGALNMNVTAEEEGAMDDGNWLRDRLRIARDALGDLLQAVGVTGPAMPKMLDGESGVTIKNVDGEPWHFTWSTNAFEDREGELFSTKALEYYVAENERREDKGYFDFWHIPGTDFAAKRWQGVVGRFLVEAGPYLDNEGGRKALAFFKQYPTGHPDIAPEGWGSSPEFVYLPEQRATGVYEWVHITRTSTLPKAAAANVYTEAKQETLIMALSAQQKEAATALFGQEFVERLETEGAKRTEQLEAAGVAFKGEAETATEDAADVTFTVESDKPVEAEATEEAAPEVPNVRIGDDASEFRVDLPVIEIDVEAIGAEVAKQLGADFGPIETALVEAAMQIKELTGRIEKLEKAANIKEQTETPRYWVHFKRASEAEETVIDNNSDLKEKKPKQHVEGSPAGHYFPRK